MERKGLALDQGKKLSMHYIYLDNNDIAYNL
jgi:hypothetical protein